MNQEFIKKMIKAKQMEIEALTELLPGSGNEHMDTIRKEMKAMRNDAFREVVGKLIFVAKDCFDFNAMTEDKKDGSPEKTSDSKVKKVTIQ